MRRPPVTSIDRHGFIQHRPQFRVADRRRRGRTGESAKLASKRDEVAVEGGIALDQPLAVVRNCSRPDLLFTFSESRKLRSFLHIHRTAAVPSRPVGNVPAPFIEEVMKVDPRVAVESEAFGVRYVAVTLRRRCRRNNRRVRTGL